MKYFFCTTLLALAALQPINAEKDDSPLTLPSSPAKAPVVIYPTSKAFFEPEFRAQLSDYVTDCKSYMESLGMKFPNGGYALFYSTPSVLILCTNVKNHNLMIQMRASARRKAEQGAAANP